MRTSVHLLLFAALIGCGTDPYVSGPEPEFTFGPGGADATSDTGTPGDAADAAPAEDTAPDTRPPGEDIIAPPDASVDTAPPEDVGLVCEPGSTWCEDTVLLTCGDDGLGIGRVRCTESNLVCIETDAGAQCGEPTIVPTVCSLPGAETIGPGEYVFDLCANGDDGEHVEQADCGVGEARSGADGVFSFTLETESEVLIDLRDQDDRAAIDTILYVRTVCEDPSTQVACSDDLPCDESDVTTGCNRGIQVRQSRLALPLAAGTYTIFADHLEYGDFGCGQVRLLLRY